VKNTFEGYSYLRGIQFINKLNGWILLETENQLEYALLLTEDGGATWYKQSEFKNLRVYKVCFINKYIGWALLNENIWPYKNYKIFKTFDSGKTWHNSKKIVNKDCSFWKAVSCIHPDTVWLGGSYGNWPNTQGFIYKTENGGSSWDSTFVESIKNIKEIFFINNQTGWLIAEKKDENSITGSLNVLLFSSDGGNNWIPLYQQEEPINKILFNSKDIGWMLAEIYDDGPNVKQNIYFTSDGGKNWELKKSQPLTNIEFWQQKIFIDIDCPDIKNCWVVGSYGAIWKTVTSLKQQYPSPKAYFISDTTQGKAPFTVQFFDGSTGEVDSWQWDLGDGNTSDLENPTHTYLYGDTYSVSLKINGPGGINTFLRENFISVEGPQPNKINQHNQAIPKEFNLFPVFPNPFNDQTKINFSVPILTKITIHVFDISGRLVETLYNREVQPGYYSINWEANNLPSGIYFIKIQSNEFTKVQKCTLLK